MRGFNYELHTVKLVDGLYKLQVLAKSKWGWNTAPQCIGSFLRICVDDDWFSCEQHPMLSDSQSERESGRQESLWRTQVYFFFRKNNQPTGVKTLVEIEDIKETAH